MKALLLTIACLVSSETLAQLAPSTVPKPAAPVAPAKETPAAPEKPAPREYHFSGTVLSVWPEGAMIECRQWAPHKNPEGTRDAQVLGTFVVRGHTEALYDDARIRFWATEDGVFTYKGLLGAQHTVRAIRFTRADRPPSSTVPVVTGSMSRIGGESTPSLYPAKKPASSKATPKLQGTSLDKPAERVR